MEDRRSKGFCDNVRVLFLRDDGKKLNDPLLNLLYHNVTIYLNMFRSLMKHMI